MSNDRYVMVTIDNAQIAALIVFPIALTGTVANVIVALFTRKLATLKNAFGSLTTSQAFGETVLCGIFAFYFCPMVFFDSEILKTKSHNAGFINLICYDICIFSHFFIALNRLFAITLPVKYDLVFSKRNTGIMIFISWICPIATALVLYKAHPCDFYYSTKYFAFVFTQNEVCNFISWNIDFFKDISIVIIIALIDVITIASVHQTSQDAHTISNAQQVRRRKNEVNFLKQVVLQGIVFVVELLTYFIFAWQLNPENRWGIFFLTTVAWNIVHCSDAIIIITFNKEFRQLICKPFRDPKNQRPLSNNSTQPQLGPFETKEFSKPAGST